MARRRILAAFLVVTIAVTACTGDDPPAASELATTTSTDASASTTRPSATATTTATSAPAHTSPPSVAATTDPVFTHAERVPQDAAVVASRTLADAYAAGDWATVRELRPDPPLTDLEYEAGFGELNAATLYPARVDENGDRVQLWLLEVAHETTGDGPRTSMYCIHWDYLVDTRTIEGIAGELVSRDDGHTPPDDAAGGAWTCDRFDEQPPATSAPPVVPPPPPPTGGVTTGLDSVNCTYDGIPLWGNVYVVSTPIAADVTAYETTSLSTDGVLRVYEVARPEAATSCGLWYVVQRPEAADLKIYIATSSTTTAFGIRIVANPAGAGIG